MILVVWLYLYKKKHDFRQLIDTKKNIFFFSPSIENNANFVNQSKGSWSKFHQAIPKKNLSTIEWNELSQMMVKCVVSFFKILCDLLVKFILFYDPLSKLAFFSRSFDFFFFNLQKVLFHEICIFAALFRQNLSFVTNLW